MSKLYLRNRLCIPVRGYRRSIVYDLLRNDYYFISNELFEIIQTSNALSFEGADHQQTLKKWKKFLIKEEILFEIHSEEDTKYFPEMNFVFQTPFLVTDLIIHDSISKNQLETIRFLECRNVSILVKSIKNNFKLLYVIESIAKQEVDSINLFLVEENIVYNYSDFSDWFRFTQIFGIYLFKSSCIEDLKLKVPPFEVYSLPYSFDDFSKYMYPEKMSINKDVFFEGLNYHSYYYRKLYVDIKGNVKNGIYSEKIFGNLSKLTEDKIVEIIRGEEFKEYGLVTKEKTLVCKDCEFRYMCIDSREPIKTKGGAWHHIQECGYNPYIAKWEKEENYQNLFNCGINLNENGEGSVLIDYEVLDSIFEKAWS